MSAFDYFVQHFFDNIPFYLLAIGLIIFNAYIKNESGLNRRGVIVLLMVCVLLTLFSCADKSIGLYLNDLKTISDSEGYKNLKEYSNSLNLDLDSYDSLRSFFSSCAYCFRMEIFMIAYSVINREDTPHFKWIISIPGIIGVLLFLTSPLTRLCFYFDATNYAFHYGPLYFFIYFVIFFYFLHIYLEIIKRYSNNKKTLLYLFFLIAITALFSYLESIGVIVTGVDIGSMLFLTAVVLYYILIESHIYYEEMEKKEKALYESKINVMTNQVRPHFIFNCIGNIVEMCDEDSKARKALMSFSKYLRVNINSLNETRPMLFDNELMYIENYVYLEKMRYAKKFDVKYKIGTTDFLVPLISVEIFVENAIKHNVGKKDGVVHIELMTAETEKYYVVQVKDDGVGFDVSALENKESVGISNAKYRLNNLVNANVEIESVVDKGTTVTITIPKEKGEE